MKRLLKSLTLVALFAGMTIPAWGQASPSTEGRDFWVTFLRADEDSGGPEKLTLTISARNKCTVTIENTSTGLNRRLTVNPGNTTIPMINEKASCYSYQSEQVTSTALHVTSTEDISLFAGNYRNKSFDAANIYPTTALLDDYLIQTYPPSAHADDPQGSHFAIVATENNTVVDYTLTAKTNGGKTGTQTTPTLKKGEVYYVWTGKKAGDEADLSGTTVKARNGKKIAVFQGCPHTNLPYGVRDRDHLFSQSMPTAYWGSEFGLTLSRNHRRDIIAVMALNDGTQVYINNEDGEPELVHTFDFSVDKKHYWTFEIGDEEAYSTHKNSPYTGKLPEPLIADSSCFLTTSCPVGVHLFMTSNTYDEPTSTAGSIGDPAMLWISPIEQVIKEISFSTYADGTEVHFMNIVTTTADVPNVVWTDTAGVEHNLQSDFHPIMGNPDYSYARIEILNGSHNLKGNVGFLAHVYGFGEKCSYAYSCGSSTIQRSVTFNGSPLMIDSVYHGLFCADEEIEMKLNIGNNDYESIEWDYGDGVTYSAPPSVSNDQKKKTTHVYTAPGWYDLKVSAVYVNQCTGQRHDEQMRFSFRVVRADTIPVAPKDSCLTLEQQKEIIATEGQAHLDSLVTYGERTILNPEAPCYEDKKLALVVYNLETEETKDTIIGQDAAQGYNGKWYYASQDVTDTTYNTSGCNHYEHYYVKVLTCLELSLKEVGERHICPKDELPVEYVLTKGEIKDIDAEGYNAIFKVPGYADEKFSIPNRPDEGVITLPTEKITKPGKYTGTIVVEDEYCEQTLSLPVAFSVYYPDSIIKYKFNNVMAVYKPGKGGNAGYEFSNYEWHLVRGINDSILVAGPEVSVLYLGQGITFEEGDEVYVKLTEKTGAIPVLPSCRVVIEDVPNYDTTPDKNQAPATKRLVNRQIVINKGDKTYNIYGQLVQ